VDEVSNWWLILQGQVWWVLVKDCQQDVMEKGDDADTGVSMDG
jgi:hypothetical protein